VPSDAEQHPWRVTLHRIPLGDTHHDRYAAGARCVRAAEDNDALKLRVFVQGGGCSGLQYGFTFDDKQNADDTAVEMGAKIDYKEDLEGSRFIINNPNASTTCGCGSSFSA
jgi:iron-sulfur cluster insertion protein